MAHDILVRGTTLPQAFSEAALRLFGLARDPAAVRAVEVREVRAHGSTLETLLGQWIGECRYIHEIEGFVCHAIDFAVFDVEPKAGGEPMRLHALLHGEEIDAESVDPKGTVGLAPAADCSIKPLVGGYEIHLRLGD